MALVLDRKENQKIVIHTSDGDIWVWWMHGKDFIKSRKKIAIDAPPSVNIAREEVDDA